MINEQRFGRTLNRFGLRSYNGWYRQRLVGSLAALAVLCCLQVMRADGIQLPVVSVVASADDGNVAANTLDKNMATRWSAQGDGQWIAFDLGAQVVVGSAKIAWYQGNQRIARFDVQTSSNGSTWTTVFSGASSGATTGLESYDVTDSTGRYLRIVCHGNTVNLWNSICEVEIYGAGGSTTPPTTVAGLLAIQAVAASSYDQSSVPANALDKNLATRWSALGEGQWISFQLGSQSTLTSAKIAWYKGVQRIYVFDIQTSNDGANWTTVFSGASSGSTIALESYDVNDSVAKFVRIVGYGNSVSLWNSIAEVELYGVAGTGGSTPPPPPTLPTVTVAASDATATETGSGTGAFTISRTGATTAGLTVRYSIGGTAGNGTDYATLSGSLTIPAGAASATVTVTPIDDTVVEGNKTVTLTLSANTAYTVGSPNSATVTIADNDQAPPPTDTTLPSGVLNLTNWKLTLPVDTSHAGSPDEILQPELNTFQDAKYFHVSSTKNGVLFNAPCGGATTSGSGYPRSELREMSNNGRDQASWSTTSGTHTMEITQAITHLPVVKPHVVAGQIHNASDDVIVFRLEGTTLFIDENGNRGPVLTTNYQLGTVFTVKFVARSSGVECYYNGNYIYKYSVSTSGCYFKAGCYTQSNTSKGDAPTAYGEVVIYGLSVTHQ